MNEREQQIIQLAKGFLSQRQREWDEAAIDANFLFRFDPTWCKQVRKIRAMMNQLLGKEGDGLLSSEDSARCRVHLEVNPDTVVGFDSAKGFTVTTAKGHYRCLDQKLREAYERVGKQALHGGDMTELEHLRELEWQEANQTSKIQSELIRIAQAYHLIPITEEEADRYAPTKIREQLINALDWVIWEHAVPSFLWPANKLIENELNSEGTQTIRPFEWWDDRSIGTGQTRLSLTTRVRTWTVYYLSKRGGGDLGQESAVELWNAEFPGTTVKVEQYLDEYRRVFDLGTRKDYFPPRRDRPSVFLSHSSKDKPFVRNLAERLETWGVRVWLDEAEINVGDSLTQKIGQALGDTDFVIAVLSRNSIDSQWVQRELQIAIQRELAERKVVVLPLLLESVEIPPFLKDKLYADFRVPEEYEESFALLLKTLDVVRTEAGSASEPISEPEAVTKLVHEDGSTRESLARQLSESRENLLLIEERKAQFVLETDIPLQLVKEERRLRDRIATLEDQLADTLGKSLAVPKITNEEIPSDERVNPRQFEEWIQASRQRWKSIVAEKHPEGIPPCYEHGIWTVAYSIIGKFQPPNLHDFVSILRKADGDGPTIQPWWVPNHSEWETEPYSYHGNVEFWLAEKRDCVEPEKADFWRASPAGMMFLLRGYYEDSHPDRAEPGTQIDVDTPVWQIGECLLHAERLAKKLAGTSAVVCFRALWEGLKDRIIFPWSSASYDLPPPKFIYAQPSRQDSVTSEICIPAEEIRTNFPELIGELLMPLDEAFGFFERRPKEIRTALSKFSRTLPCFRPWASTELSIL